LAVAVRLHQRRKNPEPFAGDHSRVGTRDCALGRSEYDAMASLPQHSPRNPNFGRIEIVLRERDENGRHAGFAGE
jgi:hypothetical protein